MKKIVNKMSIYKMTNLSKQETDLPMVVWIEVKRPIEYNKARIKFNNSNSDSLLPSELISMSIDAENPEILANDFELKISNEDLENLKKWIKTNYEELMKVWDGKQTPIQFGQNMKKLSQIND